MCHGLGRIRKTAFWFTFSIVNFVDKLVEWKKDRIRGVWIKLPTKRAELLNCLLNSGFEIHHALKDYILVTIWLDKLPNKLPSFAQSFVGAGGVVLDEKNNKILLITEKYGD